MTAQNQIRAMQEADVESVETLLLQLGYPTTISELKNRFSLISRDQDRNALFVATLTEEVIVGWVHVTAHLTLTTGMTSEVAGLIVNESHRGLGIGRALMRQAELWSEERSYSKLWLRSNVVREDAHKFYEGIGYSREKTSYKFVKRLSTKGQERDLSR